MLFLFHKLLLHNLFFMGFCYFSPYVSYFAVFDGHNGSRVSKLASQQLHNIIFAQFPPGTHIQSLELCAISIMAIISSHSNTTCGAGPMSEVERDARRVLVDSYKKLDDAFLRDACKQYVPRVFSLLLLCPPALAAPASLSAPPL